MKAKILFVDDELLNLKMISINLEKHFEVLTASSGEEGLEVLKNNEDVKVVFSDMKMPGMSGMEFVQIARKLYPDLSYIIVTGYEINEELNNALEKNLIHNYLKKPIAPRDLKEEIDNILEN